MLVVLALIKVVNSALILFMLAREEAIASDLAWSAAFWAASVAFAIAAVISVCADFKLAIDASKAVALEERSEFVAARDSFNPSMSSS